MMAHRVLIDCESGTIIDYSLNSFSLPLRDLLRRNARGSRDTNLPFAATLVASTELIPRMAITALTRAVEARSASLRLLR